MQTAGLSLTLQRAAKKNKRTMPYRSIKNKQGTTDELLHGCGQKTSTSATILQKRTKKRVTATSRESASQVRKKGDLSFCTPINCEQSTQTAGCIFQKDSQPTFMNSIIPAQHMPSVSQFLRFFFVEFDWSTHLQKTVSESARERLSASVSSRWVLRCEKTEVGVGLDGLLGLRQVQLSVVVQKPI